MPADVVNPAAVEDQDGVGGHQHRQAVRDDDEGAAFGDPQQIGVDDRFAFGVECARRLVQDQDPRVPEQRPSNGQALTLAPREIGRTLLDEGVVAARQVLDEFFRAGEPGGMDDFLETRIRLCRGYRLADRAAEQETLLRNHAKARPQVIDVDLPQIVAVDFDEPLVIAVEHLQQARHCRFARTAPSHDAEDCRFGYCERNPVECRLGRPAIAEAHILEFDAAFERRADTGPRSSVLGGLINERRNRPNGELGFIVLLQQMRQLD